jgi:hypothetical protein
LLATEASRRPDRWRSALRRVVRDDRSTSQLAAGRLLDTVGTIQDVPPLRTLARAKGRSSDIDLGRRLARHLAPRVYVEDQGRVSIRVGDQVIPGTDVRRKVLSLLCFLLTRMDLSATRDQVLEALWPELEPDVAGNSLNQTVYFLRRVFDPTYRDDVSPEYVHHKSDVLWLDSELVASRSHLSNPDAEGWCDRRPGRCPSGQRNVCRAICAGFRLRGVGRAVRTPCMLPT